MEYVPVAVPLNAHASIVQAYIYMYSILCTCVYTCTGCKCDGVLVLQLYWFEIVKLK